MLKKIRVPKWVRYTFWFLAIWITVQVVYITIDGLPDYKGTADVAVILGNRVYADGSLSDWLKGRTDKALKLYKEKKVTKIYASGGISQNDDGDYPEGTAMKNYLVEHGVPAGDVIADNDGKNTYCTAEDYLKWNQQQKFNSVIVVSQFYHITRTKYIFEKLGIRNVHSASSDVYSWADIPGTLREVPAFYKYLFAY